MSNAPHVVAIVVVHNPGTWFQETLQSLRDSDYPNFSIIFVDTSTGVDTTAIISEILPSAEIISEPSNPGFATACNIGARHSGDATHLVFCHDDVAFAPDAIRRMVEEAYLMNAGVVAPKYVVWNSPGQILSLGADMDRTGTVATRIDVGDLDQGQYDVSQEVFVAPGGAILVRRDLFEAMRGFDEKMTLYYEDVDFSWRAQLAGARIVAAPFAKVRHLAVSTLGARRARGGRRKSSEAIRSRLPRHERIRYSRRNQVRAISANVRGLAGLFSLLQYLLISIFEAAYFALTGKPKIAVAILESWLSVITKRASIRKKRKAILHYRVKTDSELRRNMIRGSARVKGYINTRRNFRAQGEEARKISGWRDYSSEKSIMERLTTHTPKSSKGLVGFDEDTPVSIALGRITRVVMWLVVAIVLVGTRHMLEGGVPLIGQFLPFGNAHSLLATYFSGPAHHHALVAPSPTSELLLGALGYIFFGGTGLEAHFVFAALIAMGLAGMFKIVSDFRNRTAAYISVILYGIGPVLAGVISAASLSGLVIFGIGPWFLLRLFRLANLPGIYRSPKLSSRYEVAVEGVWLGLILAFAPSFLFLALGISIVLLFVGISLRYLGKAWKYVVGQFVAFLIAIALNSPWIVSFFLPHSNYSAFFGSAIPAHIDFGSLLLFQMSNADRASSLFGVYLFALLASLLFVRGRKADRTLTLLALFALLEVAAIFSSYGGFGEDPIPLTIILPVAFIMAVVAIASGIEAAFEVLPKVKVGWSHVAMVGLCISVLASTYAMLGQNLSGRYKLPSQGYENSLSWMYPSSPSNPGKALWLGRPGTLPVGSYQISGAMALGVSEIGNPNIDSLFAPANPGRTNSVINAVNSATKEDTVYLGRKLAALRIKYVVVPQTSLSNSSFLTSDLNLMLSRQRDLNQLVADPSVVAFSVRDSLAVPTGIPAGQEARILNYLRFWSQLLVALIWLGLLESTLSRKSLTLWFMRKLFATRLGGFLSRISRKIVGNGGPSKNRSSLDVNAPNELAPNRGLDGSDVHTSQSFKHVKISTPGISSGLEQEAIASEVHDGGT